MRIAVALFAWFPEGGMQRDCLAITEGLRERGHELTVFTRSWRGPRPDGMAVAELPARGLTNHGRNAAFARALGKALAKERFDFVLGFDRMPALNAYFMADRCYAERLSARGALRRLTPRARAMLAMERAVFGPESGTAILLPVEGAQAAVARRYGTPAARFHPLPPILGPGFAPPADAPARRQAARRALGLAGDTLALLFVAARFHTKGLDRALRAVDALPGDFKRRVVLLVAGGDDRTRYRRFRSARFLGARDDVADLMLAADLLLHPAREELAGKVLVEAVAMGLPVLCSGIAGYAPHVLRAGAGRVLDEPFAQQALDRALAEMLAALPTASWSAAGAAYARETPGFGQGIAVAVDTIDRLARAKARP